MPENKLVDLSFEFAKNNGKTNVAIVTKANIIKTTFIIKLSINL